MGERGQDSSRGGWSKHEGSRNLPTQFIAQDDSMSVVNLDAMIPREDFDIDLDEGAIADSNRPGNELYLALLTKEGRLASLRKPEFQRETSGWQPEIVAGFIKSVVDGDVIPAIIMWRSPRTGNIFVIDGAHRLSALIAWIHDDYGDRAISRAFYNHQISQEQISAAEKARELIDKEVGAFGKVRSYAQAPAAAPSDVALKRSHRIANDPIFLQWVLGDARSAEESFFRINSTAVAINETEKTLIRARRKPHGLAARAIMHAGTGHQYWSQFDGATKGRIETLSKEIYDQLISPLVEYPVVTLDLPAQNRGYSADSSKTILDLVSYVNSPLKGNIEDDPDGSQTIDFLEHVKRATARVFGRHSGSLALHPGIYCYGKTGKFIPKAFIGAVGFVAKLEATNGFAKFTEHREAFEIFMLDHRHYVSQIGKTQGSGGRRGVPALIYLYECILEGLVHDAGEENIALSLRQDPSLSFLEASEREDDRGGSRFSKEDKAAILMKESLDSELRCPICKGWLYRKNVSKDHKVRRQDGGASNAANLQLTHPYCNTGFKEQKVAKKAKASSRVSKA